VVVANWKGTVTFVLIARLKGFDARWSSGLTAKVAVIKIFAAEILSKVLKEVAAEMTLVPCSQRP